MWNKSNKWLGIAWLILGAIMTAFFVESLINGEATIDRFDIAVLTLLVGVLYLKLYAAKKPVFIRGMDNLRCYHAECYAKRKVIDARAWPVEEEAKDDTP